MVFYPCAGLAPRTRGGPPLFTPAPTAPPFPGPLVAARTAEPPSCSLAPPLAAYAYAAPSIGAGFWQLFFAFVFGGLFFSSVLAYVGAVYALGMDNVRRAASLFRLVLRRVGALCLAMLGATRTALLAEDSSTRWADAWAVLRSGFTEARRAAAEGAEAIRLEAGLYAAAVGPAAGPHMVPLHTVHLPLGVLLIWCTVCVPGQRVSSGCSMCSIGSRRSHSARPSSPPFRSL